MEDSVLEKVLEALEKVIYALLDLGHLLAQTFQKYFSDWSREAILALLAVFLIVIGWVGNAWLRRRQRADEIRKRISSFYYEATPRIRLKEDALKSAKILFYEGRSRLTEIQNVILGFAAQREIFSEIIDATAKHTDKHFLHIEVIGDRKQGKSTLLAQLALKLRESYTNMVLILDVKAVNNGLDWQLLDAYRKIKAPRFYRRMLTPRTRYSFVVIIDDFLAPWEEAITATKASFLDQISRMRPSSMPVLLITSSHCEIGGSDALRFELSLTALDEEKIVYKLTCEQPILVPKSLTVDKVRGSLGGHRIYKNELMAFLSLLVQEAELTDGVKELELELTGTNRDALKYIAACQLVELEFPPGVLKLVLPQVNIDNLILSAKGWIRREPLSYSPAGRGLSLGAPYFAASILSRLYGISDSQALENLFADILNSMAKEGTNSWSFEEGEFVRHILYKLAKGRHFRFHGIDGIVLARSLFKKFAQDLLDYVSRQSSAHLLCLWAGTAARVGERNQTRLMCHKILHQFSSCLDPPDAQAFVTLARALNSLYDVDLREEGLQVLNLEWLMRQGADLSSKNSNVRINQAIHVYCDLLKNLGKLQEALGVLEGLPDTIRPDALTILLKAEIQGMFGDARVEETYKKAIGLAKDDVRRSPGIMVKCLLEYAEFLSRLMVRGHPGKQPSEYYAKAAECEKYAPEEYQKVLSLWAESISKRDPKHAFKLYQESLEIDQKNRTIHVNSHIGCALLLARWGNEFYEEIASAYAEGERLCREIVDHPGLEWPEKARAYRVLGEQIVGTRSYIAKGGEIRPDFSDGEKLLLQAFESDTGAREDDARKTLNDARAHRSLARFYRYWSTNDLNHTLRNQHTEKADFHFRKSYLGLPRKGLDGLHVRLHVLNCRYEYAQFEEASGQFATSDYAEILGLLESWGLGWTWDRTWHLFQNSMDALCKADIDVFDMQFDELYQRMGRIISRAEAESISKLVTMASDKLLRQSLHLAKNGQQHAAIYLNKALALLSDHLRNVPSDGMASGMLSKIVVGRLQRRIERNEARIDNTLLLIQQVLDFCPKNEGAIESLLRIGDILPFNDKRLTELQNILDNLLAKDDDPKRALRKVLSYLKTHNYKMHGRLTGRFLHYMIPDDSPGGKNL